MKRDGDDMKNVIATLLSNNPKIILRQIEKNEITLEEAIDQSIEHRKSPRMASNARFVNQIISLLERLKKYWTDLNADGQERYHEKFLYIFSRIISASATGMSGKTLEQLSPYVEDFFTKIEKIISLDKQWLLVNKFLCGEQPTCDDVKSEWESIRNYTQKHSIAMQRSLKLKELLETELNKLDNVVLQTLYTATPLNNSAGVEVLG